MRKTLILFLLSAFLSATPVFAQGKSALDFLNRILGENSGNVDASAKRLSESTRLLTDDPSNYAVYEKLEAQIRSLSMLADNSAAMLSYYRYAEALLGDLVQTFQRVRELLIARQNPVFSDDERALLDTEIDAHFAGVLLLLKSGEFNGKPVFGALFTDEAFRDWFSHGAYDDPANIDRMFSFFIHERSLYGAKMNRLLAQQKAELTARENTQGFQSTLWDIDMAAEIAALQKNQLLFLKNLLLL